jgi:hypothetical protein
LYIKDVNPKPLTEGTIMRKVSISFHKIEQFLEKAVSLHSRGRHRAINFNIAGVKFEGKDLKDLVLKEEVVEFSIDGKKMALAKKDIKSYKRLRTQKYLFFVDGVEEAKEDKPKKKTKKVDKEPTEDKE